MEPFHTVVDDLVLGLLADGRIARDEFEKRKKDGAMLLANEAWKRYLQAYEDRMARRVAYDHRSEQTTIRRCLELQSRSWARVALGKAKDFRAFAALA